MKSFDTTSQQKPIIDQNVINDMFGLTSPSTNDEATPEQQTEQEQPATTEQTTPETATATPAPSAETAPSAEIAPSDPSDPTTPSDPSDLSDPSDNPATTATPPTDPPQDDDIDYLWEQITALGNTSHGKKEDFHQAMTDEQNVIATYNYLKRKQDENKYEGLGTLSEFKAAISQAQKAYDQRRVKQAVQQQKQAAADRIQQQALQDATPFMTGQGTSPAMQTPEQPDGKPAAQQDSQQQYLSEKEVNDLWNSVIPPNKVGKPQTVTREELPALAKAFGLTEQQMLTQLNAKSVNDLPSKNDIQTLPDGTRISKAQAQELTKLQDGGQLGRGMQNLTKELYNSLSPEDQNYIRQQGVDINALPSSTEVQAASTDVMTAMKSHQGTTADGLYQWMKGRGFDMKGIDAAKFNAIASTQQGRRQLYNTLSESAKQDPSIQLPSFDEFNRMVVQLGDASDNRTPEQRAIDSPLFGILYQNDQYIQVDGQLVPYKEAFARTAAGKWVMTHSQAEQEVMADIFKNAANTIAVETGSKSFKYGSDLGNQQYQQPYIKKLTEFMRDQFARNGEDLTPEQMAEAVAGELDKLGLKTEQNYLRQSDRYLDENYGDKLGTYVDTWSPVWDKQAGEEAARAYEQEYSAFRHDPMSTHIAATNKFNRITDVQNEINFLFAKAGLVPMQGVEVDPSFQKAVQDSISEQMAGIAGMGQTGEAQEEYVVGGLSNEESESLFNSLYNKVIRNTMDRIARQVLEKRNVEGKEFADAMGWFGKFIYNTAGGTVFGNLMKAGMQAGLSDYQKEINQVLDQHVMDSLGEVGVTASTIIAFALDNAFLSAPGKAGAFLSSLPGKKAVQTMVARLVADGMAKETATNLAKRAIAGKFISIITQRTATSAASLSGYNFVSTLAKGAVYGGSYVYDKNGNPVFDEDGMQKRHSVLHDAVESGVHGLIGGAAVGAAGTAVQKFTGNTFAYKAFDDKWQKTGKFLADYGLKVISEATAFSMADVITMCADGNFSWKNYGEALWGGLKFIFAIKASHSLVGFLGAKAHGQKTEFQIGPQKLVSREASRPLSKDAMRELEQAGYGSDIYEIAQNLLGGKEIYFNPDDIVQRDRDGNIVRDKDGNPVFTGNPAQGLFIPEQLEQFAAADNISVSTKNELLSLISGTQPQQMIMPPATRTERKTLDDGTTVIETYADDGSLIGRGYYTDAKKADKTFNEVNGITTINAVAVARERNRRYNEAVTEDQAWAQTLEECGIRDENGRVLDFDRYMQAVQVINNANDPSLGHEPTTQFEKDIVSDFNHNLREARKNAESPESVRRDINTQYGINLEKTLKTDPREWNDIQWRAVKDYEQRLNQQPDKAETRARRQQEIDNAITSAVSILNYKPEDVQPKIDEARQKLQEQMPEGVEIPETLEELEQFEQLGFPKLIEPAMEYLKAKAMLEPVQQKLEQQFTADVFNIYNNGYKTASTPEALAELQLQINDTFQQASQTFGRDYALRFWQMDHEAKLEEIRKQTDPARRDLLMNLSKLAYHKMSVMYHQAGELRQTAVRLFHETSQAMDTPFVYDKELPASEGEVPQTQQTVRTGSYQGRAVIVAQKAEGSDIVNVYDIESKEVIPVKEADIENLSEDKLETVERYIMEHEAEAAQAEQQAAQLNAQAEEILRLEDIYAGTKYKRGDTFQVYDDNRQPLYAEGVVRDPATGKVIYDQDGQPETAMQPVKATYEGFTADGLIRVRTDIPVDGKTFFYLTPDEVNRMDGTAMQKSETEHYQRQYANAEAEAAAEDQAAQQADAKQKQIELARQQMQQLEQQRMQERQQLGQQADQLEAQNRQEQQEIEDQILRQQAQDFDQAQADQQNAEDGKTTLQRGNPITTYQRNEDGTVNFMKLSPERIYDYLMEDVYEGMDDDDITEYQKHQGAAEFVSKQIQSLQAKKEKLEGKRPKVDPAAADPQAKYREWRKQLDQLDKQTAHWNQVRDMIARSRQANYEHEANTARNTKKIQQVEPQDFRQFVMRALYLGKGMLRWNSTGQGMGKQRGVMDETGYGQGEKKALSWLFNDKEGMPLETFAKRMSQEWREYASADNLIPVDGDARFPDDMEARNEIIDILSSFSSRDDLARQILDDAQRNDPEYQQQEYERQQKEDYDQQARDLGFKDYDDMIRQQQQAENRQWFESQETGQLDYQQTPYFAEGWQGTPDRIQQTGVTEAQHQAIFEQGAKAFQTATERAVSEHRAVTLQDFEQAYRERSGQFFDTDRPYLQRYFNHFRDQANRDYKRRLQADQERARGQEPAEHPERIAAEQRRAEAAEAERIQAEQAAQEAERQAQATTEIPEPDGKTPSLDQARELDNAQRTAANLGLPVIFTDSDNPIHKQGAADNSAEATRRGSNAYVFFPKGGGEPRIVINVDRCKDWNDVYLKTLHEGSAHYGLRQMFGKDYDTFLDNVYDAATDELRAGIDQYLNYNPQYKRDSNGQPIKDEEGRDMRDNLADRRQAVDEYLAHLAEKRPQDLTQPERTLWAKIKEWFISLLRQKGFNIKRLTDEDLIDLLRESHRRLLQQEAARRQADPSAPADRTQGTDRYSIFGGNKGYVGYSMSKRAEQARDEGRYPKTDFKREYKVGEKPFTVLSRIGVIESGEWHHTSKYGNRTTFHKWEEPWTADAYLENKAEIDKLCKQYDAKLVEKGNIKGDWPETAPEYTRLDAEMEAISDQIRTIIDTSNARAAYEESERQQQEKLNQQRAEANRTAQLRTQYNEEVVGKQPVPATLDMGDGWTIQTNGSRNHTDWQYFRNGNEWKYFNSRNKDLERDLNRRADQMISPSLTFEQWRERRETANNNEQGTDRYSLPLQPANDPAFTPEQNRQLSPDALVKKGEEGLLDLDFADYEKMPFRSQAGENGARYTSYGRLNERGRKEGLHVDFDIQGNLINYGLYHDGRREGMHYTFNPQGDRLIEGAFSNGTRVGTHRVFYDTYSQAPRYNLPGLKPEKREQVRDEITYNQQGRPDGEAYSYSSSGKLLERHIFKNGKLLAEWYAPAYLKSILKSVVSGDEIRISNMTPHQAWWQLRAYRRNGSAPWIPQGQPGEGQPYKPSETDTADEADKPLHQWNPVQAVKENTQRRQARQLTIDFHEDDTTAPAATRKGRQMPPSMLTDEELLLRTRTEEGSTDDWNLYNDEYDRRHRQEYADLTDHYRDVIEKTSPTLEDAYDMLATADQHFHYGGYASPERTELLAQRDVLEDYITQKETEQAQAEEGTVRYSLPMETPENVKKEMFDIRKQAKSTKTWLKAPNNKSSNLDERQWTQVRTTPFKEWFGDWQTNEARQYILEGEPASSIENKKIMAKPGQTFRQAVAELFQTQGGKANSAFGEVLLDPTGVSNDIHHGMGPIKNATFASVKDVLEKGRVILPMGYYETSGKKQMTGFIAAPINIDGERYVCVVGVIRNKKDNKLYIHEAFSMKKLQLDAASNVVHDGEAVSPHPAGAVAKLVKNILTAKNSSKIVDGNGEPLVVYHQTDADFTVFDPHHPGSGTNDHHLPFGIFLKPTKSDIGMRGKKQMPLYANIKNPLVVADRNSLTQYLRENVEGYSELLNRYNNIDREYKAKFDEASDRSRRKYTELWHQWKDGKISEDEYQRGIDDREEEAILKEWKEAGNKLSAEMKKLVDGHFRSSDYDGIILENDEGSFGRSTKTILAFDENQVKSATDNIGTFNPSNGDIRFSLPGGTTPDPSGNHVTRGIDLSSWDPLADVRQHVTDSRQARLDADQAWTDHRQRREQAIASHTAVKNDPNLTPAQKNRLQNDMIRRVADVRALVSKVREGDRESVKAVTQTVLDLADAVGDGLTRGAVKKLMHAVENATTKRDVKTEVDKAVDAILTQVTREAQQQTQKLLHTKATKLDPNNIRVAGQMDEHGQRSLRQLNELLSPEGQATDLDQLEAQLQSDTQSSRQVTAGNAHDKLVGLNLAKLHRDTVAQTAQEIHEMRQEVKQLEEEIYDIQRDDQGKVISRRLKPEYSGTNVTPADKARRESIEQQIDAIQDAIQDSRVRLIQQTAHFNNELSAVVEGGKNARRAWAEQQRQHQDDIMHDANRDLQGVSSNPYERQAKQQSRKDRGKKPTTFKERVGQRFSKWLGAPFQTFDTFLRKFGYKSPQGEGYLYNRFSRQWTDSATRQWLETKKDNATMDAKVQDLFGEEYGAKHYKDIYTVCAKMDAERRKQGREIQLTYTRADASEPVTLTIGTGQALYIILADQQVDGRMKLRKQGITEADVDRLKAELDPRILQMGDWIVNEFLPAKREWYNETYKRIYGADMAENANYFPLQVFDKARSQKAEVGDKTKGNTLNTKPGSIVERKRNTTPLDPTADAFDVLSDHVTKMNDWASWQEMRNDLSSLNSNTAFRNKVENMPASWSLGYGEQLFDNFQKACELATGSYDPQRGAGSDFMTAMAKNVTAAKINFRIHTAIKQLHSHPAFWSDAAPTDLIKAFVNFNGTWKWAMENLPVLQKRWQSRTIGDTRLEDDSSTMLSWLSSVNKGLSKYGMLANAGIDAYTCASGARAVYDTRMRYYTKQLELSHDEAHKLAVRDATVAFNQSQQSSEGMFVSPIQRDRDFGSVMFTTFRNGPMGYGRQLRNTISDLKVLIGNSRQELIDHRAKQLQNDFGIPEDKAQEQAEKDYNRRIRKDLARLAIYGYVVGAAWNMGANLMYYLLGDDDDKKAQDLRDDLYHGVATPIEGLAGGNWLSDLFNNVVVKKDKFSFTSFFEIPFQQDIERILDELDKKDPVPAYTNVVNLLAQGMTGTNLSTLTDVYAAVADAAEGYKGAESAEDIAEETTLAMLRIIQTPSGSSENYYLDRLKDSDGNIDPERVNQFCRRYVEFKKMKDSDGFLYEIFDNAMADADNRYAKRYNNLISSRPSYFKQYVEEQAVREQVTKRTQMEETEDNNRQKVESGKKIFQKHAPMPVINAYLDMREQMKQIGKQLEDRPNGQTDRKGYKQWNLDHPDIAEKAKALKEASKQINAIFRDMSESDSTLIDDIQRISVILNVPLEE